MNTRQQASGNQPDSPETKKLKKLQERTIQQQALKDILRIRAANNGKLSYGDIKHVIDKYESKGFSCVTRRNLRYRISMLDERNGLLASEVQLPMNDVDVPPKQVDEISPLTECTTDDLRDTNGNNPSNVRISKRKANENKKKYLQLVSDCITKVATELLEEKNSNKSSGSKKLPRKSLQNIIDRTEAEYCLVPGTIKPNTIRSRLRRNNVTGIHKQRTPVLKVLEPLIVAWCTKMAQIGMSMERENVIELVNDLIKDTDFETQFVEYKRKC
jgi:hypothetical protein